MQNRTAQNQFEPQHSIRAVDTHTFDQGYQYSNPNMSRQQPNLYNSFQSFSHSESTLGSQNIIKWSSSNSKLMPANAERSEHQMVIMPRISNSSNLVSHQTASSQYTGEMQITSGPESLMTSGFTQNTQYHQPRPAQSNISISPQYIGVPPINELPKTVSRKSSFNFDDPASNHSNLQSASQRVPSFAVLQPIRSDVGQESGGSWAAARPNQGYTSSRLIKQPPSVGQSSDNMQPVGFLNMRQEPETQKGYIQFQRGNYEVNNFPQFANLSNSVIYSQAPTRPAGSPTGLMGGAEQLYPKQPSTQNYFQPLTNTLNQPQVPDQPRQHSGGFATANRQPTSVNPYGQLISANNLIESLQDEPKVTIRGARSPEISSRGESRMFTGNFTQLGLVQVSLPPNAAPSTPNHSLFSGFGNNPLPMMLPRRF